MAPRKVRAPKKLSLQASTLRFDLQQGADLLLLPLQVLSPGLLLFFASTSITSNARLQDGAPKCS